VRAWRGAARSARANMRTRGPHFIVWFSKSHVVHIVCRALNDVWFGKLKNIAHPLCGALPHSASKKKTQYQQHEYTLFANAFGMVCERQALAASHGVVRELIFSAGAGEDFCSSVRCKFLCDASTQKFSLEYGIIRSMKSSWGTVLIIICIHGNTVGLHRSKNKEDFIWYF